MIIHSVELGRRLIERSTLAMHHSLRCGAKTRRGTPCMAPAVCGKNRCRMHGGAPGTGAPKGNKNAIKHGFYTREAIAERKKIRQLIRQSEKLLRELK